MADLVQTAANVTVSTSGLTDEDGISAVALTAGQPVYLDPTSNKWSPGKSSGTALLAGQTKAGIAETSCPGANQKFKVFRGGTINVGATTVAGETYVFSTNAGHIAPVGDLVATNFVTVIGQALDTLGNILTPGNGAPISPTNVAHG